MNFLDFFQKNFKKWKKNLKHKFEVKLFYLFHDKCLLPRLDKLLLHTCKTLTKIFLSGHIMTLHVNFQYIFDKEVFLIEDTYN